MVAAFPSRQFDPSQDWRLIKLFGTYTWDWILAAFPDNGNKPRWRTQKGELQIKNLLAWFRNERWLVGVRFGNQTSYAMLDIDAESEYHSGEQLALIKAALESIGITRTLLIQSSYSGGWHLCIPFPELISTFDLAVTLHQVLTQHGFRVRGGQLEIFPNIKTYAPEGEISRYNAHRLPLQPGSGSFLLDADFNPIGNSPEYFCNQWDMATGHQDMEAVRESLAQGRDNYRRRPKRAHSGKSKAEQWRSHERNVIERGWTGLGQTNDLLKVIARYGRVFEGLGGMALTDYIIRTAIVCPGYWQFCRHQRDIERRARDWQKCVEKYYWPLGSRPLRQTKRRSEEIAKVNQNEVKAAEAQQRLIEGRQRLIAANRFPEGITDRANALSQECRMSLVTLYKPDYQKLWHPKKWVPESSEESVPKVSSERPRDQAAPKENLRIELLNPLAGGSSEKLHTLAPYMKYLNPAQSSGDSGETQFDAGISSKLTERDTDQRSRVVRGVFQKENFASQGGKPTPGALLGGAEREAIPTGGQVIPRADIPALLGNGDGSPVPIAPAESQPSPPEGATVPNPTDPGQRERDPGPALTQLSWVPGEEVSARTPEQLTEHLRSLRQRLSAQSA